MQRFLTTMATYRYGNPDHRRQVTVPAPSNEELEARLRYLLTPGTFANLKTVTDHTRQLRERVLTLPVMAAIILSLVYRQVSGLSEVLRLLEQEGLMWVGALKVSKQALSNRLRNIPAHLFAQMFEQVLERQNHQNPAHFTSRVGERPSQICCRLVS